LFTFKAVDPDDDRFACDIHDDPTRPSICRNWTGQKTIKGQRIYFPPACSFNKEESLLFLEFMRS
jgi:hypothetical protein